MALRALARGWVIALALTASAPLPPAAAQEDVTPASPPTAGEPSTVEEPPPFDPGTAEIAPPAAGREADPRAYAKPGWLPLRGRERLGCVTTNCNGGGHLLWGMDIAYGINEPIYATGSGRVYLTVTDQGANCNPATHPNYTTCPNGARGNAVLIDHGDNVYSFYGHVRSVRVKPGQMVTDGTVIASAGNSGWTPVEFPHLHYEEWSGLTWAGGVRTPPRDLKACHGTSVVTYPDVAGTTSWNGIPGFGYWLRHDGVCNPSGPLCVSGFYDVLGSHQFCYPIRWMAAKGITTGYDDNLFHPTRVVSRQTAVAWLYRLAGSPTGTFPSPGLRDVPTTHPYRTEISWAVDAGIVNGYEDGTFRGETRVTRAEFIAYLHRMAGEPPGPFPDPGLSDVTPDRPFYEEISWAIDETVARGYADDTFRRGEAIVRQGGSTFLYRFDKEGF